MPNEEELSISELEDNYYKAAIAIMEYKDKHGFVPGVKVIVRYREEPEKKGIIAPYGAAWGIGTHAEVPVRLDNGGLQLWNMSNIKKIGDAEIDRWVDDKE